MAGEIIEIILQAIDNASDTFSSVTSSAEEITSAMEEAGTEASEAFGEVDSSAMGAEGSIQDVIDSCQGIDGATMEDAATAADDLEQEANEAAEALSELNNTAGDVMAAETLMGISQGVADSMMSMVEASGNYSDSMMRASLEAEGFGISAEEMGNIVSQLSDTTGRAGGQIRESFITATARGVTDMDSFKKMMEGAGAQATLFGTDIQSMANSFSGLAAKATISEKFLANMGITMDELGTAMGMTGATADEVKNKWKELDTNQRAAALGMAASMNEGKNANEAYKNSWAGMQEQLEMARGKLERLVGDVLAPTVIPVIQLATSVMQGLGDVMGGAMSSPLGGLISLLGTLGGAFVIAVAGVGALKNMLGFLRIEETLTAIQTTALAIAEEVQGGASLASAAANAIGATGFAGLATAAWGAATAVWAVIAPLLPFIAIGAAVVLVIYEIGKAFGWWTDVGSMLDAIWAGVQRLWDAFINHPDVQAVLTALTEAWNVLSSAIGGVISWVMSFFETSNSGEFDVVRALIDAIGMAWNALTFPLRMVISVVQAVIGVFNQFRTGQIDLPTFIMNIMTLMFTAYQTVFNQIMSFVISIGAKLVSAIKSAALRMVNGMISNLRALPGRVYSLLHSVVSKVSSAIQAWISTARSKVATLISNITSPFHGVASAISSALSGVVSAIKAPFEAAYNAVKPILDKIKAGMDMIGGITGAAGFELGNAAGFELSDESNVSSTTHHEVLDVNYNINIDLTAPSSMSSNDLMSVVNDRDFLVALTGNRDFQELDARVKSRISLKNSRMRGV